MRFNKKRISVHHVGGRSGTRAFPISRKFERDVVNVLYDADPDCLAQIQERNQNLESELHVLPYCLADACKSTSFYITHDPNCSSLYNSNPDYASYYYFHHDHDYIVSEVTTVMEKRQLETVSLDQLLKLASVPIPPPDFLSLDTQGSEYEILLGAKEILKSNVVALVIEAEFHPLYKGQKLFGDLTRLLSDQGFHFVRFLNLHEMSPFRAPIGLRSEGFHVYTNALFFRRIDDMGDNEDELDIMLRKLAFIAIVFNQFEYALECLRRSKDSVNHHSTLQEEEPVYLRFLRDIEQYIEGIPIVYPDTFVSKYPSFAASKSRFENPAISRLGMINKTGTTPRIEQLFRPIRVLYLLLKRVKQFLNKFFSKIGFSIKAMFPRYTDVEGVLIKYGLKTEAHILRKNRIIQTQFLKKPHRHVL